MCNYIGIKVVEWKNYRHYAKKTSVAINCLIIQNLKRKTKRMMVVLRNLLENKIAEMIECSDCPTWFILCAME